MLIDTHCHLHDTSFEFDQKQVLKQAKDSGVEQLIVVGTSGEDSEKAVAYASSRKGVFASVGLHPHDAKLGEDTFETIARLVNEPKVVAIGEFGLDYFYNNSPKQDQLQALEYQLFLAQSSGLPCIFHVRDAFDDFWSVFDAFSGIQGVIHSFTSTKQQAQNALDRGLYLGLNGIMTFTKDIEQIEAAKYIPLQYLLLETDAPFLTPKPKRGTMNVPANVELVATFLARLREESLEELCKVTTSNARELFRLPKELL